MKIQVKKQTVIAGDVVPMRSFVAMFIAALLLAACGDDNKNAGGTVEDGEVVAIVDKMISGVSQKGPFVNGSSVTVQELDGETMSQTGLGFEGKIKNDLGEFSVKVNKLESQYALLKANGFYRNEVTGGKSKSQITLYALTDLSNRDEVNVNLLTHLAYERSLYLATTDTLSVAKAKKQAEVEVLKSFGIEGNFASAEDLNIFGADDQSAALLAVSILMQSDLSEGDFSERLADYAADIESDGIWNDTKTATEIADWANSQGLGSGLVKIRDNITKWEISADVPSFEKYVNNFWWQNYGLGICDAKREGEVLKNQNTASVNADVYYICKSNLWQVASDIEKDTYKWLDPAVKHTEKDGDVRYGDVVKTNCYVFEDKTWRSGNANDCSLDLRGCTNLRQDTVGKGSDKVWYICDARSWRDATTYEKDTFGWKTGVDGEIKKGSVTDTVYVFDKTAWRVASAVEGKLGGCVDVIADSVGKVGTTYYICKSDKWVEASALEYDTYHWSAGKDGDSKVGGVNTNNCYVYENKAWRSGNKTDCSLNLRGCTALRQDTVGLGSDKVWHICDTKSWRNATNIEKDTATWGAGSFDGEVRAGQVNKTVYYIYETSNKSWRNATVLEYDSYQKECTKNGLIVDGNVILSNKYVCDEGVFRTATENDIRAELGCTSYTRGEFRILSGQYSYYKCETEGWVFTTEKNQGTMTDERDGHVYKTIVIKTQMWMAENLNYEVENSFCYNDDPANCATYGRLYTWAAATTVCPSGWHLPSKGEFETLFSAVGGSDTAGKMLKSTSGWSDDGNGTDAYAFSALPAGSRALNGDYYNEGYFASFWSSTELNSGNAYEEWLEYGFVSADPGGDDKNYGFSVRCLKD